MTDDWRKRLFALIKERGFTQTEVNASAEVSVSFLTGIKTGTDPGAVKLARVCRVLGITVDELLHGGGSAPALQIPVVGTVGAGEGWIAADEDLGAVSLDIEGGQAVALEVKGESMMPVYRPGDYLIGAKRTGSNVPSSAINSDCIVMTESGDRYVKFLAKSSIRGRYTLRSYNPMHADIVDVRLQWAAPIVWVRRRG